jgi:hypothetical protein
MLKAKNINTHGHSVHSTTTVIITSFHLLGGTCTGDDADSYYCISILATKQPYQKTF